MHAGCRRLDLFLLACSPLLVKSLTVCLCVCGLEVSKQRSEHENSTTSWTDGWTDVFFWPRFDAEVGDLLLHAHPGHTSIQSRNRLDCI
jgi:hypothetical protein